MQKQILHTILFRERQSKTVLSHTAVETMWLFVFYQCTQATLNKETVK